VGIAGSIASPTFHNAEFSRKVNPTLDERGICGGKWSATQVMRLLEAERPFDVASAA
jgi:hypothetical protein